MKVNLTWRKQFHTVRARELGSVVLFASSDGIDFFSLGYKLKLVNAIRYTLSPLISVFRVWRRSSLRARK